MIRNHLRPWGDLKWVLSKYPQVNWDFIGCVATEDRFASSFSVLKKDFQINRKLFLKVIDPPSEQSNKVTLRLSENETLLKDIDATVDIQEHFLLEPYGNIVEALNNFLNQSSGNIVLDISTMPKRFFFPLVKLLIKRKISNLVVAYSSPAKYCASELSSNPQSWDHLPLFMSPDFPEKAMDIAIVGVGFMPFSLPSLLLSKYNAIPVTFLFPFPPGPPNYQRTWEFMRKIEKSFTFKTADCVIRVNAANMPDAFEQIVLGTHNGSKQAIFAPYGPKPFSLAMCIYATLHDSPVYYTQPTYYHPEYSVGTSSVVGYSLILNSRNLYS